MEPPISPNRNSDSGGGDGDGISSIDGVAPFVLKTYQMVSDPSSDHLISWAPANNSFVVSDPLLFSGLVLPSNFKHSNFSSFIRQLNTYGFRKVDPDRWEFANEWFLRGQKHLLMNIYRRKHNIPGQINNHQHINHSDDGGASLMEREIENMRRDQKEMDKELQDMTRRLETTERRPEQMMEFLCKVVEDPQILPKIIVQRERERRTRQRQICQLTGDATGKKRRLITTPSNSEEGSSSLGVALSSTPEVEPINDDWFGGGEVETNAPPYPFSLLGGGFI